MAHVAAAMYTTKLGNPLLMTYFTSMHICIYITLNAIIPLLFNQTIGVGICMDI